MKKKKSQMKDKAYATNSEKTSTQRVHSLYYLNCSVVYSEASVLP